MNDIARNHIIPFAPCPLDGHEIDVYFNEDEQTYMLECPHCGLVFGLPYGYHSRLDLLEDWNKRV